MRDIQIETLLQKELVRQRQGLELIASENFASKAVMKTMGSCLTNKYAEGYPGMRYYGGCEVIDEIETLAIDRLNDLFGSTYANVQPHSGAQANAAIFLALLEPGDTILGFELSHGGHLSHGSPVNFSGKVYKPIFYGVEEESGLINMEKVAKLAELHKPKLIICGASAYPRDWDYKRFRQIADSVGALLLGDIAHPAGLIAGKQLDDPIPHCHVISSTTHKTLRGPRGGLILMGEDFENPWGRINKKGEPIMMSSVLNSGVFPGMQGGPLEHVIAAKAIAFEEASHESFIEYTKQVISNAKTMAKALKSKNYTLASGGTDNHLLLIDLRSKSISGKKAEKALVKADITVNKNMVPFDDKSPFITSGIRIGTAAITTRGLDNENCEQIVEWIDEALLNADNELKLHHIKIEVNRFMGQFPLYQDQ